MNKASGWWQALRARAEELERSSYALYLAYRDPRTPWWARAWAALVLAYALSPIDLIPDFIPILGYLDDLLLVPAGIALAIKMIPPEVWAESRARAERMRAGERPVSWVGAVAILTVWVAIVVWVALRVVRATSGFLSRGL